MKGIVYKSTGSWYLAKDESGKEYKCRFKGKFKIQGIKNTNPIAVGDHVEMEHEGDNDAVITEYFPRQNYIIRKSTNLSKQTHIIAANIDQAFIVASLVFPKTQPTFIDRFLVTAEAYGIRPLVIFNKFDLYGDLMSEELEELTQTYKKIGYTVLHTSATKGIGIKEVIELLKDKTSLFTGNSGVGKSSLVNAIEPTFSLKTGIVSKANSTGKHTTTFAEMFDLSFGGKIIDTPGLRSFGMVDFEKKELARFFPEMKNLLEHCQYYNCTHINEPKCAVKGALEKGEISISRYNSYLNMYYDEENEKYRE